MVDSGGRLRRFGLSQCYPPGGAVVMHDEMLQECPAYKRRMRLTTGNQIHAGKTPPDRQPQGGNVNLTEVYVGRVRSGASTERFLIDYRQPRSGRHCRIDIALRRPRVDESRHVRYGGNRCGIIAGVKPGVEADIYKDCRSMKTQ